MKFVEMLTNTFILLNICESENIFDILIFILRTIFDLSGAIYRLFEPTKPLCASRAYFQVSYIKGFIKVIYLVI
jgi:hypothetical protein